jgi:GTPase SAR1 family protein
MENTNTTSKKVLVIGEVGVGKSYILNRLLNKSVFKSGMSINSVTKEINSAEAIVNIENNQMLTLTSWHH